MHTHIDNTCMQVKLEDVILYKTHRTMHIGLALVFSYLVHDAPR